MVWVRLKLLQFTSWSSLLDQPNLEYDSHHDLSAMSTDVLIHYLGRQLAKRHASSPRFSADPSSGVFKTDFVCKLKAHGCFNIHRSPAMGVGGSDVHSTPVSGHTELHPAVTYF